MWRWMKGRRRQDLETMEAGLGWHDAGGLQQRQQLLELGSELGHHEPDRFDLVNTGDEKEDSDGRGDGRGSLGQQ